MPEEFESPEIFPLESTPPYDFRCGREEQNTFLHTRAWPEQQDGFSVTYLAHLHGVTVGFMTVAMDAIPLQTREKPRSDIKFVEFPAMKIVQLAVDHRWERQGIGQSMVALAAALALRLSQQIGCRYLTVDAKPDVVEWYRKQEFKVNNEVRKAREQRAYARGIPLDRLPVSMRIDLFSLLKDLQDRYPHDFPQS
jgi:GNAT superfamily N-acetyltransferase